MAKGFIYILSNPSMPGLIKIGKTTREVEGRANELYQTGVPVPFVVEYSLYTPDCDYVEREVHSALEKYRVAENREFFVATLKEAIDAVEEFDDIVLHQFLAEFRDDHTFVHFDEQLCPANLSILAHHFDSHTIIVTDAINELTADELAPAMARVAARVEKVKSQMEKRNLDMAQKSESVDTIQ